MLLTDFFERVYVPLRLRGRNRNTLRLYRRTLAAFGEHLGRPPTIEDLRDDAVAYFLLALKDNGLAAASVEKERNHLLAMWRLANRRNLVSTWPDIAPEIVPERTPQAWMMEEYQAILKAAGELPGFVGHIRACLWWTAILKVAFDTAERIGAILKTKWADLSGDGWLVVNAETRKFGRQDASFKLHPTTLAALSLIRNPQRELIFPWPHSLPYLYDRYRVILRAAGLPDDRRSKFHRIRRTTASHYAAAGGNAQELLRHSHYRTTKKYLDPRIVQVKQPSDLLYGEDGES